MPDLTPEELRQLALDAARAANPDAKQADLESHVA